MNLFDDTIQKLRGFIEEKKAVGELSELKASRRQWPQGERGNIVLASDTAVELGNPENESVSFIVWTENTGQIRDGRVNLIGPDLPESRGKSLPFGRAVILGVNGMDENNCYERHRQIDIARYNLDLRGYMMRAVSQYMREWSRVSNEAVIKGFNFAALAGALSSIYSQMEFVESIEYIFVTSSTGDVRCLGETGTKVQRLIGAMNKMAEELSFDCGSCDYTDICGEVEGLRNMRKSLDTTSKNPRREISEGFG